MKTYRVVWQAHRGTAEWAVVSASDDGEFETVTTFALKAEAQGLVDQLSAAEQSSVE
jgi:hypothetical protein